MLDLVQSKKKIAYRRIMHHRHVAPVRGPSSEDAIAHFATERHAVLMFPHMVLESTRVYI